MKRAFRVASMFAAAVAFTNAAQAQGPSADRSGDAAAAGFARSVSLGELGFAAGLRFGGFAGGQEIFVPAPRGLDPVRATFSLRARQDAALAGPRHVAIFADDRLQRVVRLPDKGGPLEFDVDVPPGDISDGFIKIGLRYGGGTAALRCRDELSAGDVLDILPETSLRLAFAEGASVSLADAAALMPQRVRMMLPEGGMTPAAQAAALRAAAMFRADAGRFGFGEGAMAQAAGEAVGDDADLWTEAELRLTGGDAGGAASGISVAMVGGVPVLTLSGDAPQEALGALSGELAALGRGPSLAFDALRARPGEPAGVPLQEGGGSTLIEVVERGVIDAGFEMAELPAGTRPASLMLDVSVAQDPEASGVVVSAFMNDVLLGSRSTMDAGRLRLDLSIPEGLAGASNSVRVGIQRRAKGMDCIPRPTGFPAQLLASSVIRTEPAGAAQDFHDLAPGFAQGGVVVIDPALGLTPQAALARIAPVYAALASGAAAPVMAETLAEGDAAPFLWVSADPPAGAAPAVRFDEGEVRLLDADGAPLLEGARLPGIDVAQLVDAAGRAGVWLRLGDGPPMAQGARVRLDRGDVAFIDAQGLALALSSERRDLMRVVYPDRFDPLGLIRRYYTWIILLGWAALTVVVVLVIRRLYRSRRASG